MKNLILSLILVFVASGIVTAQYRHEDRNNAGKQDSRQDREVRHQTRDNRSSRPSTSRQYGNTHASANSQERRYEERRSEERRSEERRSEERRPDRRYDRRNSGRVVVRPIYRQRTPRFRIYFPRYYFSYHFDNYNLAEEQGYHDGLYVGEDDAINGRSYFPERTSYYTNSSRFQYSSGYRFGFLRGYKEGY